MCHRQCPGLLGSRPTKQMKGKGEKGQGKKGPRQNSKEREGKGRPLTDRRTSVRGRGGNHDKRHTGGKIDWEREAMVTRVGMGMVARISSGSNMEESGGGERAEERERAQGKSKEWRSDPVTTRRVRLPRAQRHSCTAAQRHSGTAAQRAASNKQRAVDVMEIQCVRSPSVTSLLAVRPASFSLNLASSLIHSNSPRRLALFSTQDRERGSSLSTVASVEGEEKEKGMGDGRIGLSGEQRFDFGWIGGWDGIGVGIEVEFGVVRWHRGGRDGKECRGG